VKFIADDNTSFVNVVCKTLAIVSLKNNQTTDEVKLILVLLMNEKKSDIKNVGLSKKLLLPYTYLEYSRDKKGYLQYQFVILDDVIGPAFVVPNVSTHPGFSVKENCLADKKHLTWDFICIPTTRFSNNACPIYTDYTSTDNILSITQSQRVVSADVFKRPSFMHPNLIPAIQQEYVDQFEERPTLDMTLTVGDELVSDDELLIEEYFSSDSEEDTY